MVDFLALTHQPSAPVLVARWLRAATPEEIRRGYHELLAVATLHQVRYWLLDLRRRGPASPELIEWVQQSFFPHAARELQGCIYLSYFISPDHLEQLRQQPEWLQEEQGHCLTRFFTDERQATEWLNQTHQQEQAA